MTPASLCCAANRLSSYTELTAIDGTTVTRDCAAAPVAVPRTKPRDDITSHRPPPFTERLMNPSAMLRRLSAISVHTRRAEEVSTRVLFWGAGVPRLAAGARRREARV